MSSSIFDEQAKLWAAHPSNPKRAKFELAEYQHRCAWCGKFVSDEKAFTDVQPGGCRGHDYCEAYCNVKCADKAFAKHHLTQECICEV